MYKRQANYWATKFSNSNKFARKLTKLLTMAQKYLGINVIIKHVIGKLNGFADTVSRGKPSITLDTHLKKISPLTLLPLLVYRSVLQ